MWSVVCVRRGLLPVKGGKSGKRKAGRAGIFDFLFLNFFATQISAFQILLFCLFFLLLSGFLYLVGGLYILAIKKQQTTNKSVNILGIRLGIFRKWILDFFGRKILGI